MMVSSQVRSFSLAIRPGMPPGAPSAVGVSVGWVVLLAIALSQ